jgi:hypothetical protein
MAAPNLPSLENVFHAHLKLEHNEKSTTKPREEYDKSYSTKKWANFKGQELGGCDFIIRHAHMTNMGLYEISASKALVRPHGSSPADHIKCCASAPLQN